MKKIFAMLVFLLAAGCASKEPPFDAVAVFNEAEGNMRTESFEKARKGYQQIQEKSPDKSYDAVLMLRVADTYYGEEKYSEALVEYQAFLNYHPVNKDAAYAQYQIAMCNYRELTTTDRDPSPAYAVVKEMQRLLDKYPESGYEEQARRHIAVCRDRIADYELYVGRFYHKKGAYPSAISRFEKLLQDYPGCSAEKDALYYLGLSYQKLGEKDQALSRFETLVLKYPVMKAVARSHINELRTP